MQDVSPNQIAMFMKRFRFASGHLLGFRVINRKMKHTTADLRLSAIDNNTGAKVRLKVSLDYVEEFRFQRRPGPALIRLQEVRLGHFEGLFYFNLDAWNEEGPLKLMDFRASDAFVAGQTFRWEINTRSKASKKPE